MSAPDFPKVYEGGCHCGAVRFRVRVTKPEAVACNCSICRQKGFLHLIVPPSDFTLLQGEDALTCYTFNTGIAKHLFCRFCGIHSFYRPRSHPEDYDVNLHCLDEDVVNQFQIVEFDGVNWEANISQIVTVPGGYEVNRVSGCLRATEPSKLGWKASLKRLKRPFLDTPWNDYPKSQITS